MHLHYSASAITASTFFGTGSWAQSSSNAIASQTASYLTPTNSYQITNLTASNGIINGNLTITTYTAARPILINNNSISSALILGNGVFSGATVIQNYFNSVNVTWVNDSTAPGGYAISIAGQVNLGGEYGSGFPYIPVDSNDVYYMECYIKNVTGTNTHYMGSMDYNEAFTSLGGNPGSFGYWVMNNTNPGTAWTKEFVYLVCNVDNCRLTLRIS